MTQILDTTQALPFPFFFLMCWPSSIFRGETINTINIGTDSLQQRIGEGSDTRVLAF